MRWSGSSYTGEGRVRQSPPVVQPIAVALLTIALGGCTGLGLPLRETAVDRTLTTGSIEKVSSERTDTVAQSDWEAVRQSIARAASDGSLGGALAWRNPATGTLRVLDTVTAANDANCRNFQTTVNDMRGIRHYRGETCPIDQGHWELYGVLADDSKLL